MGDLRNKIIRLAYQKPHLREHLLPLLHRTRVSSSHTFYRVSSIGDRLPKENCYVDWDTDFTECGAQVFHSVLDVIRAVFDWGALDGSYTASEGYDRALILESNGYTSSSPWDLVEERHVDSMKSISYAKIRTLVQEFASEDSLLLVPDRKKTWLENETGDALAGPAMKSKWLSRKERHLERALHSEAKRVPVVWTNTR